MHEDEIEKALRKVRTVAGVKFFGLPIGSVITPGMVKLAREAHGDKKTDAMLHAQRRNTRRDARQAHFQNQAQVRAKKREDRLTANAAHRDRVARDKDMRAMDEGRKKMLGQSAYSSPIVQAPVAPKAPVAPAKAPSKQATNKDAEDLFDLVHHPKKWDQKQVTRAIELAMKLKATADPTTRQLLMALVQRLRNEE